MSRNSKCEKLCKTGGWHLKIAVSQKVLTAISALLFSTRVFEDCLRGLFSSCCSMSWIVIKQYCQQVTRKPSSCFYNKSLLRVTREKTFMLQFIEEFYKIFHQQYKSCLTYLVHSWNAKNYWGGRIKYFPVWRYIIWNCIQNVKK